MNEKEDRREELQEELNQLDKELAEENVPKVKDDIDWSKVIKLAEGIIEEIQNDVEYNDEDDSHWIYEEVFKAVYGKDVFKWMDENIN